MIITDIRRSIIATVGAIELPSHGTAKASTYLSDRSSGQENRDIRRAVLGDRAPASTVIIAGTFDDQWLLEIEAIAVG